MIKIIYFLLPPEFKIVATILEFTGSGGVVLRLNLNLSAMTNHSFKNIVILSKLSE